MILSDVKEYLLVNSFQYFIGQDDIEVTDEVLTQLSRRALNYYALWRPLFIQESMYVSEYKSTIKLTNNNKRILNIQNLFYIEPILVGTQSAVDFDWDYNKDNGFFRCALPSTYVFEMLVAADLEDLDMLNIEFLDLLQALYLMYVGSSRKAFNLSEQPFENDGADIYQAGQELWETTLETLKNEQQNWYNAIN